MTTALTSLSPAISEEAWSRIIVQVECLHEDIDGNKNSRAGTAFFVTPTHLLTAAHLADMELPTADEDQMQRREEVAKSSAIRVRIGSRWMEARVVDVDLRLDAMLLHVGEAAELEAPPLLESSDTRMERWWSRGFPAERNEADAMTMEGTVRWFKSGLTLNGVPVSAIELFRDGGTYDPKGHSGGPVVLRMEKREWIIGLVRRSHGSDPGVIWATPIQLVADRFARHGSMPLEPFVPLLPPAAPAGRCRLILQRVKGGLLHWQAEGERLDFRRWWTSPGDLVLDFAPSDERTLVGALARLALHGGLARIEGRFADKWRDRFREMADTCVPLDACDAEDRVAGIVTGYAAPAACADSARIATEEFVRQIHAALDQETLHRLNDLVLQVLDGRKTLTKWRFGEDLAMVMNALWPEWHRRLEDDLPATGDFLRLMLQAGGNGLQARANPRAWVGPETLKAGLLLATLMTLAFVAAAGKGDSDPSGLAGRTSNFTIAADCGHACGVALAGPESEEITLSYPNLAWEADYILLPCADMPPRMVEALGTRMTDPEMATDLRDISVPGQVYVGGCLDFRHAVRQGLEAVKTYVQDAIASLEALQARTIQPPFDLVPETSEKADP
ncbi:MAG: trypsin-like peptidase domain-containing protein [Alphaproteobacteria bacterium]|nr:trypsin-like peptidase domain-containing protein [Alphaproteobacteria bacterium]